MSRACEQCEVVLVRREDEKIYNFAKRKFCGLGCVGASHRTPAPPPRNCEYCGELLVRGAKEEPGRFAKRRFCGKVCANATRAKNIDILGVVMTRQELADVLGVTDVCIGERIRDGRCPVTGKKTK